MRRILAAAALVAVAVTSLVGCAHSGNGGGDDCAPRWPHVSERVVRAGESVTVTASAATCPPRFEDGRRLTLTGQNRAGDRFSLGTTEAYPSGAFATTFTVPEDARAGRLDVDVDGFAITCGDTGSCAAYTTAVQVVDSRPDFATDPDANAIASRIGERLQAALRPRASFVAVAIVTDGVEVVLQGGHDDRDRAAAEAAFATAQEEVGDRSARLHVESVLHGSAELDRLTTRIAEDDAWQQRHGIEPTAWGPDLATDSVRIALRHYRDADAVLLAKRYGDAVTVSTEDTPAAAPA